MTVNDIAAIEKIARETAARLGQIILVIGTPADHSTQICATVPNALKVVSQEAGNQPCVIASELTTHYLRL